MGEVQERSEYFWKYFSESTKEQGIGEDCPVNLTAPEFADYVSEIIIPCLNEKYNVDVVRVEESMEQECQNAHSWFFAFDLSEKKCGDVGILFDVW